MHRSGIATAITLVVLTLALMALLTSTSYMALALYRGGAGERKALQAALIAESALEAFPLLVRAAGCLGAPPAGYILSTQDGDTYAASYRYSGLVEGRFPENGTVTVQAQASSGGGTAVLERAFQVACGILGAVPAALTSRPDITVAGDAQVIGLDPAQDTGAYPVARVLGPGVTSPLPADTLTLSVDDPSLLTPGSYVQIPSPTALKTYQVTAVSGQDLTLRPLFPPAPTDRIPPSAPVRLVPYAVKAYDPGTATLTLSQTQGLLAGQEVEVAGASARVVSVDPGSGQVRLEWETSPPSSLPEGTPLKLRLLGAASAGSISTDGGGQILYGSASGSPLVPYDTDLLFQRTFGLSKADFLALYPPAPASSFDGTVSDWELRVVQGPLQLTGARSLCGRGILVVVGNLTVNDTCGAGFQGLVYVIGDYDQQGNSVLTGSVVVEGVANLQGCPGQTCDTRIRGTGQGGGKIAYDPVVMQRLRNQSRSLAAARPLAGTWRRR